MNPEVKAEVEVIAKSYLQIYLPYVLSMIVLLIIAGLSVLLLGSNNAVEQDVENVVEQEVITPPAPAPVT